MRVCCDWLAGSTEGVDWSKAIVVQFPELSAVIASTGA